MKEVSYVRYISCSPILGSVQFSKLILSTHIMRNQAKCCTGVDFVYESVMACPKTIHDVLTLQAIM